MQSISKNSFLFSLLAWLFIFSAQSWAAPKIHTDGQGSKILEFDSEVGALYTIESMEALQPNGINPDGSRQSWQVREDLFPSMGTKTKWMDFGKHSYLPRLPHPRFTKSRQYRYTKIAQATLSAPTVILNINNNSTLSGEAVVLATVSAADPILKVILIIDGQPIPGKATSGNTYSFSFNTHEWANGSHSLRAAVVTTGGGESTPSTAAEHDDPNFALVEYGVGVSAAKTITFNNFVSEYFFTTPFFDPAAGQSQRISAKFKGPAEWELQIWTEHNTLVGAVSGSGSSMAFEWDGKNHAGFPTSKGFYDYVLVVHSTTALSQSDIRSTVVPAVPAPAPYHYPNINIPLPAIQDIDPREAVSQPGGSPPGGGPPSPYMVAPLKKISKKFDGGPVALAPSSEVVNNPRRDPNIRAKGFWMVAAAAGQGHHVTAGGAYKSKFAQPTNIFGNNISHTGFKAGPFSNLKSVAPIANGFTATLAAGGIRTGGVLLNDALTKVDLVGDPTVGKNLLLPPSTPEQSFFNKRSNVSLLVGHGVRGKVPTSGSTYMAYLPILDSKEITLANSDGYDWVPYHFMKFGSQYLKWMFILTCNNMGDDIWNSGLGGGGLPITPSLSMLLGMNTTAYLTPGFGSELANRLLGTGGFGYHSIMNAWRLSVGTSATRFASFWRNTFKPMFVETGIWYWSGAQFDDFWANPHPHGTDPLIDLFYDKTVVYD